MPMSWAIRTVGMIGTVVWQRPFRTPGLWLPPLPGRLGRPGLLFLDCGCRHCRDGWDGPDYCSQDCGFRHCRDGWDGPDYCSGIVASAVAGTVGTTRLLFPGLWLPPLPGRLGRPGLLFPGLWLPPLPGRLGRPGLLFPDCGSAVAGTVGTTRIIVPGLWLPPLPDGWDVKIHQDDLHDYYLQYCVQSCLDGVPELLPQDNKASRKEVWL